MSKQLLRSNWRSMLGIQRTSLWGLLVLSALAVLVVNSLPLHAAQPVAQFAGCATEDELPYAARVIIHDVNDLQFDVTVLGVGEFDPQLMILDEEGELVACNNNRQSALPVGVELPTAQAGFKTNTAQLHVRYLAEENPDKPTQDFELVITGADGRSGQFVLLIEDNWVFDATDIDSFSVVTTDEQANQGVPINLYVASLGDPQFPLNPEITMYLGEAFSITCSLSDFGPYCEGETIPLQGFTVTLGYADVIEMTGQDVMLNFQPNLGGEQYRIDVGSQDLLTYGPYIFMVHSGVAYPQDGQ